MCDIQNYDLKINKMNISTLHEMCIEVLTWILLHNSLAQNKNSYFLHAMYVNQQSAFFLATLVSRSNTKLTSAFFETFTYVEFRIS